MKNTCTLRTKKEKWCFEWFYFNTVSYIFTLVVQISFTISGTKQCIVLQCRHKTFLTWTKWFENTITFQHSVSKAFANFKTFLHSFVVKRKLLLLISRSMFTGCMVTSWKVYSHGSFILHSYPTKLCRFVIGLQSTFSRLVKMSYSIYGRSMSNTQEHTPYASYLLTPFSAVMCVWMVMDADNFYLIIEILCKR